MYCREEVGFIQTTCHRMGRWKTGKQGREPGTVQAAEVLAQRVTGHTSGISGQRTWWTPVGRPESCAAELGNQRGPELWLVKPLPEVGCLGVLSLEGEQGLRRAS